MRGHPLRRKVEVLTEGTGRSRSWPRPVRPAQGVWTSASVAAAPKPVTLAGPVVSRWPGPAAGACPTDSVTAARGGASGAGGAGRAGRVGCRQPYREPPGGSRLCL